jgi:hypothetical protein
MSCLPLSTRLLFVVVGHSFLLRFAALLAPTKRHSPFTMPNSSSSVHDCHTTPLLDQLRDAAPDAGTWASLVYDNKSFFDCRHLASLDPYYFDDLERMFKEQEAHKSTEDELRFTPRQALVGRLRPATGMIVRTREDLTYPVYKVNGGVPYGTSFVHSRLKHIQANSRPARVSRVEFIYSPAANNRRNSIARRPQSVDLFLLEDFSLGVNQPDFTGSIKCKAELPHHEHRVPTCSIELKSLSRSIEPMLDMRDIVYRVTRAAAHIQARAAAHIQAGLPATTKPDLLDEDESVYARDIEELLLRPSGYEVRQGTNQLTTGCRNR